MSTGAPRILRRLLAWALPSGRVRDGLLGDLDELYAERVRMGRVSADLWYARQLLSASVRYLPRRLWARRLHGKGEGMMEGLGRDLGHSLRTLRRRPGFATVIVLTLALGIGANTAVFSVVRSVLLRPLPFPEDERLAVVLMRSPSLDLEKMMPSAPEYVAYRDHARSWEELAAYEVRAVTVTGDGSGPERVDVAFATSTLFATLQPEPLLGRAFTEEEDREGSDGVAVLSHAFWTSRFGRDPQVIGRTVQLDGISRTVVGVMSPGFRFPTPDVRLWLPLAFTPQDLQSRGLHRLTVVGRLGPSATLASAEGELDALVTRFTADPSFDFHDWHPAYLRSLRSEIGGDVSRTLWVMLGAAALVLLIACANVASLLLVRAEERAREMSLRTALGAGRRRIFSQLLTESLVLAAAGGAAGVAVAYLGVEALRAVAPADLPRLDEIRVDAVVLAFTMTLTLTAGVLFGLVPALRGGRADLQGALRDGGRSGTAGRRQIRLRQLLVVSETALAVVLLVAAGLLLQKFRQLMAVDPGFRAERLLTATIAIPDVAYPDAEDVVGFYQALLPGIASLPGVAAAGAVSVVPLAGTDDIEIGPARADVLAVTPGYFAAMGIPLLEGRVFEERDDLRAPLVAVVSEALARHYWPDGSALGGEIRQDSEDEGFAQVVGVVPDVRQRRLDRQDPYGTMYLAHAQTPLTWGLLRSMTLTIRASTDPTSVVSAIQGEVHALDPSIPLYQVRTMEQAVADITATQRFSMLLQGLFAVIALSLAAVGLYGMLAFTVARRASELGIRMALGAERTQVQLMVLRQGMGLVAIALLLGLAAAHATGRLLASLLFGVSPGDPAIYATVVGVLLAVALLACWIPARRASGVDPVEALRSE